MHETDTPSATADSCLVIHSRPHGKGPNNESPQRTRRTHRNSEPVSTCSYHQCDSDGASATRCEFNCSPPPPRTGLRCKSERSRSVYIARFEGFALNKIQADSLGCTGVTKCSTTGKMKKTFARRTTSRDFLFVPDPRKHLTAGDAVIKCRDRFSIHCSDKDKACFKGIGSLV